MVETLALILIPLCGKKEQRSHVSGFGMPSGKSSRVNFYETATDSPSPWGEGRDEGGRETIFQRKGDKTPIIPLTN
jgi:hypothetical protein